MGQNHLYQIPNFKVRPNVSTSTAIRLVVLIAWSQIIIGCAMTENPKVEAPPPAPTVQEEQPQQMAKLPPPDLAGVQEVVKRVFKDSALIDTNRKPVFVAGDFNGDQSQDIAVVLKPSPEKLSDLNEEFANWLLRDPLATDEPRKARLRVAVDDTLLAVVHGYGENGWRDSQATQTFLLKNVVGSDMETRQPKDVAIADKNQKRPRLRGDVISEVLQGRSGYLYYSGATYEWYDPKTYKGDPEPGMFHGAKPRKVKERLRTPDKETSTTCC